MLTEAPASESRTTDQLALWLPAGQFVNLFPLMKVTMTCLWVPHLYGPVLGQTEPELPLAVKDVDAD